MIGSGVFDRRPKLQVLIVHLAGIISNQRLGRAFRVIPHKAATFPADP
jgi:hypothetical protein